MYLVIITTAIVILILLMLSSNKQVVPQGAPNDYFDLIENIESKNTRIYLFSDDIDFYDDIDYIEVDEISLIPSIKTEDYEFIIFDLDKFIKSDESNISDLFDYYNNCYNIILVNNSFHVARNFLDEFDIPEHTDSQLITLGYSDQCSVEIISSYTNYIPSKEILTYNILDEMTRVIKENLN